MQPLGPSDEDGPGQLPGKTKKHEDSGPLARTQPQERLGECGENENEAVR